MLGYTEASELVRSIGTPIESGSEIWDYYVEMRAQATFKCILQSATTAEAWQEKLYELGEELVSLEDRKRRNILSASDTLKLAELRRVSELMFVPTDELRAELGLQGT